MEKRTTSSNDRRRATTDWETYVGYVIKRTKKYTGGCFEKNAVQFFLALVRLRFCFSDTDLVDR
jgi:hypothetical protein